MPPVKKTASAAKRSKVMGGAEDDSITDAPPVEAQDSELSSRAKDKLFGDAPKDSDGVRPAQPQGSATAVTPDDATQTEVTPEAPPERHNSNSYEQEHADKTAEDADFEAEEKEAGA